MTSYGLKPKKCPTGFISSFFREKSKVFFRKNLNLIIFPVWSKLLTETNEHSFPCIFYPRSSEKILFLRFKHILTLFQDKNSKKNRFYSIHENISFGNFFIYKFIWIQIWHIIEHLLCYTLIISEIGLLESFVC